jgi:hypothetical protein
MRRYPWGESSSKSKWNFDWEKRRSNEKLKSRNRHLWNFFCFNFCDNLKTFDVVSFLTPLDSRNLTTVKFLESALPQGESDYTVCVASSLKTCRGLRLKGGELHPVCVVSVFAKMEVCKDSHSWSKLSFLILKFDLNQFTPTLSLFGFKMYIQILFSWLKSIFHFLTLINSLKSNSWFISIFWNQILDLNKVPFFNFEIIS